MRGKIHLSLPESWSRERAVEPLGLVHSDVCGKISSPSLSHAELFPLCSSMIRHFMCGSMQSSTRVKFFRSLWNGSRGKYTATELENYLKKEGIEHQYTISKTPNQNGVLGRINRTLVGKVRSRIADSKLLPQFWAEALSTAAYLINQSSIKPSVTRHHSAWVAIECQSSRSVWMFGLLSHPKGLQEETGSQSKKEHILGVWHCEKGISAL